MSRKKQYSKSSRGVFMERCSEKYAANLQEGTSTEV